MPPRLHQSPQVQVRIPDRLYKRLLRATIRLNKKNAAKGRPPVTPQGYIRYHLATLKFKPGE